MGVLGVSCSSASIPDETDSGTDLPADQVEQGLSEDGEMAGETPGEGQASSGGFSLDGEPIVVVSDNVDCVIRPPVTVEPANLPSIADVHHERET